MVLNKDEFIEKVKARLGEDLSDSDIEFLEDMTDTYDYLAKKSEIDWKQKYDDLDKSWRQKYIDRFNGKVESDADFIEKPTVEDNEVIDEYEGPKTYEDLFTEK